MNGMLAFLADSKVHDSVLLTMVITSFLASIRRFKEVNNEPIVPGLTAMVKLLWNFFFDWVTGFWSMKTGQSPRPAEIHVQSSEQTPTSSKTQDATFTGASDPTPPVANPAPTK